MLMRPTTNLTRYLTRYLTGAALTATLLALSPSLAAPAFARGGDAVERQAERTEALGAQSVQLSFRQTADSGSGAFLDFNHTQTVETKRLKRRRHKR